MLHIGFCFTVKQDWHFGGSDGGRGREEAGRYPPKQTQQCYLLKDARGLWLKV